MWNTKPKIPMNIKCVRQKNHLCMLALLPGFPLQNSNKNGTKKIPNLNMMKFHVKLKQNVFASNLTSNTYNNPTIEKHNPVDNGFSVRKQY